MINSLSIILPFYNEEKRLGRTFREIIKFSKKNKIKFKEFLFVDDGSFDNSYEIALKRFRKNFNDITLFSLNDIKDCEGYLNINFKNVKEKNWVISRLNLNRMIFFSMTNFLFWP